MPIMKDEDIVTMVAEVFTVNSAAKDAAAPKSKKPTELDAEFSKEEVEPAEGVTYSELFGWDDLVLGVQGHPNSRPDFIVEVFNDSERVPELDEFREVDHNVMYPLVMSMQPEMKGLKTMLVGPTGSGKTTLVEYYCAKVKKNMFRINGRQDMETDSIIGRWIVNDSGMEFLLGEFSKAIANGDVVLVDEPWKIPPGIWMSMSRVMERGGVLQIDDMGGELGDKTITPHHECRILLADNVVGTGDNQEHYPATMIQDGSTLNRIDVVLHVPYMSEKQEVELLARKYPILVPTSKDGERGLQNVERMIRMLNLLRKGHDAGELSVPVSLRTLFSWADLAIKVRDYGAAFKWTILNRYADDTEKSVVLSHYHTVYNKEV